MSCCIFPAQFMEITMRIASFNAHVRKVEYSEPRSKAALRALLSLCGVIGWVTALGHALAVRLPRMRQKRSGWLIGWPLLLLLLGAFAAPFYIYDQLWKPLSRELRRPSWRRPPPPRVVNEVVSVPSHPMPWYGLRNTNRRLAVVWVGVFVLLAIPAGIWLKFYGYADETRLSMFAGLYSDAQIARNLSSRDNYLVYSSLRILAERQSRLGVERARVLLSDQRGWIHGAMYLGALGEAEAIPYLIKGLRMQYGSGLYPDITEQLRKLTSQDIGEDFSQWHQWWMDTHPNSSFNFDSHLDELPRRYNDQED